MGLSVFRVLSSEYFRLPNLKLLWAVGVHSQSGGEIFSRSKPFIREENKGYLHYRWISAIGSHLSLSAIRRVCFLLKTENYRVDWSFGLTCAKFSPSLCETNFAAFRMPSSDCRKSILFPTSKMGTCFWVDSYKCSRMKLLARSGKIHLHLHSFNPIANSQKCPIDRTIIDKNGAVRSSKVRIAQTPKALNKNKSNWHNLLRK